MHKRGELLYQFDLFRRRWWRGQRPHPGRWGKWQSSAADAPGVTPHPDKELAAIWSKCPGQRTSDDGVSLRLRPASLNLSSRDDSNVPATKMQLLIQSKSMPLVLVAASHGSEDALTGGKVMSFSSKPIASYRVGWIYSWGTASQVELGRLVRVEGGIKPGFSASVPAQQVALNPNRKVPPKVIGFFVAEVRYADGSVWKLDRKLMATPSGGLQPEHP